MKLVTQSIGWALATAALFGCSPGPHVFENTTPIAVSGQLAPASPPRVEVIDNKIVIHEKIQFEYDKATILHASDSLLAEIAQTIKANPHIKKIRIEGHASAEGSHDYNMKLSDARARSVMKHLIDDDGIPAEMLSAQGYGETKPIADNETDEGREKNRRVEFLIVEQEVTETKFHVDEKTGAKKQVEQKTETHEHPEAKADMNEPAAQEDGK